VQVEPTPIVPQAQENTYAINNPRRRACSKNIVGKL